MARTEALLDHQQTPKPSTPTVESSGSRLNKAVVIFIALPEVPLFSSERTDAMRQKFLKQAARIKELSGLPISQRPFADGITQISNCLDFDMYMRLTKEEVGYQPRLMQSLVLRGLYTIIPDNLVASGHLHNPIRMKVIDSLLAYLFRLNDYQDFAGAGRSGLDKEAEETKQIVEEKKRALDLNIEDIPGEEQREEIRRIIDNAVAENIFIERYIRLKRHNLSFDDIEKYRSLINAINNCTTTAIILGSEQLQERLPSIKEELSWEAIYEKYSWVFGDNYQNNAERAIIIMHNIAMAGQVDDDFYGSHIDKSLNTPSFSSAAMAEHDNDKDKAKEFLNGIKRSCMAKARKVGLGFVETEAIILSLKTLQQIHSFITRMSRRYSKQLGKLGLLDIIATKFGKFVREKAYIEGSL